MNYQCNLDIFEGPLDLLLHLIKEQKMDIYDIHIAEITKQYLTYLDLLSDLNLEIVGEYLVMAAELTNIKSKTLLPVPETEEDALLDAGEDPRAELMLRLLEYQRYKEAAFELRQKEYDQQQLFSRTGEVVLENSEAELLVEANVFDLLTAFQKILKEKSFKKNYEIKVTTLSVSDRIGDILEILNNSNSVTFDSLFTTLNTKQEVIVTFLSILELMRLQLIRSQQARQFDVIRIYAAVERDVQEEILKNFYDTGEKELPLS
ncbi:MAG: segregation/condensation protein A [Nitrospina sp.]|nr:segregation/condensation protein A [Nitrospina sp.]